VALRHGRYLVGESDAFAIDVHAFDGALLRRIRYPRLDRDFTDAALLRQRAIDEAGDNEGRRLAAEILWDEAYWPQTRPPYSALEVDRDGNIWVREWHGVADRPYRWLVLDPEGRALAVVEVRRDCACSSTRSTRSSPSSRIRSTCRTSWRGLWSRPDPDGRFPLVAAGPG